MAGRKMCFFLLFSLLSASAAYSQELRFMGGMAISWPGEIRMGGAPEAHWEATLRAGAVAGIGIGWTSQYMSIEVEGLFSQKGCRIKNFYGNDFIGYTYYRLNELSFPVLFKLSPLSGTSPYFLGGYEFSFILSHRKHDSLYNVNLTKETKKTDSSLIIGVGFRKRKARHFFFIEGRFHLALQQLSRDYDFWYFPYRQIRSFVLMIGLAI